MTASVLMRPPSSVVFDPRDDGRALRVTWHPGDGVFVLSMWRGGLCASTFRLTRADTPELVSLFAQGLADVPSEWSSVRYERPEAAIVPHGLTKLMAAARRRLFRRSPR